MIISNVKLWSAGRTLYMVDDCNTYMVRFRIIRDNGAPGIDIERKEVSAASETTAIEILKRSYEGGIRVDRIERINQEVKPEKKKKKSFLFYIFGFFFVCAALSKFIERMF